jgi:hypothetical protein
VKDTEAVVPPQRKGAKSDIRYSKRVLGEKEGKELYEKARKNLLDVNRWQQLAGPVSAAFYLTDPFGKHVDRLPLQGDYIKIHLPANPEEKFDWVRIEAIEEQKSHVYFNWIVMRVRPTDPPRQQEETEHFFSKDATSSFSVERSGRKVTASVMGRNELPNIEAPGLLNKVRNVFIALGAMIGLNYPQWKALVKGIITK